MFKNYLITTIRFLKRNKLYSFINIFGLTLGVTCSIIIFLTIEFESSYDSFHKDSDKIYRVVHEQIKNGEAAPSPAVPYPMPEALRNDFPNLDKLTIVDANWGPAVIAVEKSTGNISKYSEEKIAYVEPQYFQIFSYNYLYGNPSEALKDPNSVVITESLANKYFGQADAVRKTLLLNGKRTLMVGAIIKDPPKNTSLPFEVFFSYVGQKRSDNWGNFPGSVQCYIQFDNAAEKNSFLQNIPGFAEKHLLPEDSERTKFALQSLDQIHFDDRYYNFETVTISQEKLFAMGAIAVLILLISAVNYVNLNIALGINRSSEVGIRKVFGGTQKDLSIRFLLESFLLTFFAFAVSLGLTEILLPSFNSSFGFNVDTASISSLQTALYLIGLFVVLSLAAGFYPAIFISRFNPIRALKNKLELSSSGKFSLRKILVIFQFGVSQALLIGALIVIDQMNYFENADIGFEKESVVEINIGDSQESNLSTLKSQLLSESFVSNVSFSNTGTVSGSMWGGDFTFSGEDIKEGVSQIKFVDNAYINTYGLQLVVGQNINETAGTIQHIVNQKFVKLLGYGSDYSKVIGKNLKLWGNEGPIIGVVKDFVTTSLHQEIEPVIIEFNRPLFYQAAIKLKTANVNAAISRIDEIWNSIWTDDIFDFDFLDETYKNQYIEEKNLSNILSLFTVLALVIGGLGLFGLASFIVEKRAKEVGIRKVLGANIWDILKIFNKEFVVMIIWGFVIFAPFAYYFMNNWLQSFAHRINISPVVFIISITATMVVAVLTVSIRSMRTALRNPTDSLRYE